MKLWNSGKIWLASGVGPEREREDLTQRGYSQRVVDAIMKRGDLASKLIGIDKAHAHHIIPVGLLYEVGKLCELIDFGWDFNEVNNGVPLAEGFHGTHPNYTNYVLKEIKKWIEENTGKSLSVFEQFVKVDLTKRLVELIDGAKKSGKKLDEYFKGL
jgi:hypothetical protein